MSEHIYAEEQVTMTGTDGTEDSHTRRWACEPPAEGATFRVLKDEWSENFTVRTISAWVEVAEDA